VINRHFLSRAILVVSIVMIQPSLVGAQFIDVSNGLVFMLLLALAIALFLIFECSFSSNSIHALLLFSGISVILMSISLFRGDTLGYVHSLKILIQAFFFIIVFNLGRAENLSVFIFKVYVGLGLLMTLSALSAYLGLISPFGEPFVIDGFKTTWSIGLTLTSTLIDLGNGYLMRPSGPFDEPGRFAMVLIFSAIFALGDFKNIRWFFASILCIVVTTSLAGIIAAFFLLMHYFFSKREQNRYFIALVFFIIIAATLVAATNLVGAYEFIQAKVIGRLEYDPEIGFVGNNRYSSMIGGLNMLLQKPLFGFGSTYVEGLVGYDRSSIFGLLAQYGIVGTALYLAPFFVLLVNMSINKSILLVPALLVLIFARPYIYSFHIYMFLFVWYLMHGVSLSRSPKRIM
jgi:hypothetical protein